MPKGSSASSRLRLLDVVGRRGRIVVGRRVVVVARIEQERRGDEDTAAEMMVVVTAAMAAAVRATSTPASGERGIAGRRRQRGKDNYDPSARLHTGNLTSRQGRRGYQLLTLRRAA